MTKEEIEKNKYNLRGADLRWADLRGADLRWADLTGTNLTGAYLTGAYLRRADLSEANLTEANLRGADLSRANLSETILRRAYLTRADLTGANLSGADLSGAEGIKYVQASWADHGEIGRQLSAVLISGEVRYFCGCWSGTIEKLRDFIQKGEEQYKRSRTIAADFCEARMKKMMNHD